MRLQRRSNKLMATGLALVFVALGLFISLFFMQANANISPNPNGISFEHDALDGTGDTYDDFVEVDWQHWRTVNPDLIAWVNVSGTAINYPILRGVKDDPSFYLHHDTYRNYSVFGVPYLDTSDDGSGSVLNAIVYGHHMDNGSMFSDFAKYSDETYAREHATICLQTPAGKQRLSVAYVRIINGDEVEKHTRFTDEEAFRAWYEDDRSKACVVLDNSTDPPFAVTFCTCSYHEFSNERTLVICIPID